MGNTQAGGRSVEREEREEMLPFSKTGFDSFSVLAEHQGGVTCMAVVDVSTVATGSDDGEIILWDVDRRAFRWRMHYTNLDELESDGEDTGAPIHANPKRLPRSRGISTLLPLPDLDVLVSSALSFSCTIWSLATGEQLGFMSGKHHSPVRCLVAVPDYSHVVATAGADPFICLWTAAPAANASNSDVSQGVGKRRGASSSGYFLDTIGRTSTLEVQHLLAFPKGKFASVQANSSRVHIHCLPDNQNGGGQDQVLAAAHDAQAVITHLMGIPDRSEFVTGDDRGKVVVWGTTTFSPCRTFALSKLLKLNKILQMTETTAAAAAAAASSEKKEQENRSYSNYANGVFGIEDDDLGGGAINGQGVGAAGGGAGAAGSGNAAQFKVVSMDYNPKHAALAVAVGSHFVILPLPESKESKKCDSPDMLSKCCFAHKKSLQCVRWVSSSNGQFIVTSGDDNSVKVWDPCTTEQRRMVLREAYHSAAASASWRVSNASLCDPTKAQACPPTPASLPLPAGTLGASQGSSAQTGGGVAVFWKPFSLLTLKRRRQAASSTGSGVGLLNSPPGAGGGGGGVLSTPPGAGAAYNELSIHSRSSNNSGDSAPPCNARPSSTFFRPFRPSLNQLTDPVCDLEMHTGPVPCVSLVPNHPCAMVSASADGRVILWGVGAAADMRTVELLRSLVPASAMAPKEAKPGLASSVASGSVKPPKVLSSEAGSPLTDAADDGLLCEDGDDEDESSDEGAHQPYDAARKQAYLRADWMSAGSDIEFQRRNWQVSTARESNAGAVFSSDPHGSIGTPSQASGLMQWSPLHPTDAASDAQASAFRTGDSPLFATLTPQQSPSDPLQRMQKVGSSSYVMGMSAFGHDDDTMSNGSPTAKPSSSASAEEGNRFSNTSSTLAGVVKVEDAVDDMPIRRKGSNRMHSFTADQHEWAKFAHAHGARVVGSVCFPRSPPLDTCPPPPAASSPSMRSGAALPIHGCTTPIGRQMHSRGFSDSKGFSDPMLTKDMNNSGFFPTSSSVGDPMLGTSVSSATHLRMAAKRTVSANRIPLDLGDTIDDSSASYSRSAYGSVNKYQVQRRGYSHPGLVDLSSPSANMVLSPLQQMD